MYINGFLIPVPGDKKAQYQDVAERFWDSAKDYGAQEQVEAWEVDVKDGQWTDFRRAVDIQDGEKVVFSWMVWPDKATAGASHEKMMNDERMQFPEGYEMPFDGKRMVWGGFTPVVALGA